MAKLCVCANIQFVVRLTDITVHGYQSIFMSYNIDILTVFASLHLTLVCGIRTILF